MHIPGVIEGRYSVREFLAYAGASVLEDKSSVFVGTGLPIIAAMLAQKTHAPDLLLVFEAGGIGPQMPELAVSVGDSRTFHRAVAASSMHDVMSMSQLGYIDFGFLGAAQIDVYGNINTTVIGPYDTPKVRLPGSGGANDVGSFAGKLVIIIANQSLRTFVKRLDFLTTAGYLDGPGARERHGLAAHTGPYRVVTQLAIYDFAEDSKRLRLISLHPGITASDVTDNSEFEIDVSDNVTVTPEPTEESLRIMRHQLDPAGIVLGK